MPYPGTMTTVSACPMISAASAALALFTVLPSSPPAASCAEPKAPKSTLLKLRFMALHMMIERIRPDDPSKAPAIISKVLSSTKPMATAERPA